MSLVEHKQLIVRTEVKNFFKKDEQDKLETWIKHLIEDMKMNLLSGPHTVYVDREQLRGWSGVCMIETSHVALHVWDEKDPILVQLDVYTCGSIDCDTIINALAQFEPVKIEGLLLDREDRLNILDLRNHLVV